MSTRDRKYMKTPIMHTTTRAGCWNTFCIMSDATGPSAKRQFPMNSTSPMIEKKSHRQAGGLKCDVF